MLLLLITIRQSVHECTQKLFQLSELFPNYRRGSLLLCITPTVFFFFGTGARAVYRYKPLQLVQVTLSKHTSTSARSIKQDTRHGAISLYPVHLT